MTETTFTKAQLAQFDGKDGNKAYVAIDGIVYDLTNVDQWATGRHHGKLAGQDLSVVIDHTPHKRTVLDKLTAVGKYIG
ncbi:cytochrome B5 [Lentilactobacillus sp. IMAU92037]|uniref:cytochrome b5 domain-containing protein n=1 Tax=Lentilactobacillus dabitei TaxID=2831523 RepID=UPI001C2C73DB|nr:cytochrome b5 domain-containing protein [Lentilactobacillus dabitei]MBV0930204.1 cytochrome B5 [Lentilactobacillus dabitei]